MRDFFKIRNPAPQRLVQNPGRYVHKTADTTAAGMIEQIAAGDLKTTALLYVSDELRDRLCALSGAGRHSWLADKELPDACYLARHGEDAFVQALIRGHTLRTTHDRRGLYPPYVLYVRPLIRPDYEPAGWYVEVVVGDYIYRLHDPGMFALPLFKTREDAMRVATRLPPHRWYWPNPDVPQGMGALLRYTGCLTLVRTPNKPIQRISDFYRRERENVWMRRTGSPPPSDCGPALVSIDSIQMRITVELPGHMPPAPPLMWNSQFPELPRGVTRIT